jgi:adenosylcobinamide-phosphate synthase
MAHWLTVALGPLAPDPVALGAAVAIDLAIGDPVYRGHPVRLVGHALSWMEERLRRAGAGGYGGGMLLLFGLSIVSLGVTGTIVVAAARLSPIAAWVVHVLLLYSLLALGDLLHHVWRIEKAVREHDLPRARTGVAALVGRDTDRMDEGGCRRAAVESLSENLTDGFVSPVMWYAIAGLPGIVLFKVVSTMDSMVGNKTPRYLRFGWCGARLDDVMNYVPARITWMVIAGVAAVVPGCSAPKAWRVGWRQHAILLGPNSGWSEAATAGAVQRRLVGPIWLKGVQVTDLWIGDARDPPLATGADLSRAMALAVASGVIVAAISAVLLLLARA